MFVVHWVECLQTMIYRTGCLLLFVTVLIAVIKTGTGSCSKDSLVYMMVAACGVSKRSQFNNINDYPIVTKKEFDSLLARLKGKEESLAGIDALDTFLLPVQEMSKDADPTENYKQLSHFRETQHAETLLQRPFSPRIVSPLLARKQDKQNENEDILFDSGKETNGLYVRSKRSPSVIITPEWRKMKGDSHDILRMQDAVGTDRFNMLVNKCCNHLCTVRDFREFCY